MPRINCTAIQLCEILTFTNHKAVGPISLSSCSQLLKSVSIDIKKAIMVATSRDG